MDNPAQILSDFGKILIPAIVASIPGFVALYIAIKKTPHETKKIDADSSVTYLETARTAEELVQIKDARIKKLEARVRELELENERQCKEIKALKVELESFTDGERKDS